MPVNTPGSSRLSDIQEVQNCSVEVTEATTALESNGRPSPVDSPYTSARSPSGHLIPYSPVPARRYSRDISWITGGHEASLHDEPGSMNLGASESAALSIFRTNSSTTIQTQRSGHTPNSDIPIRPASNSSHRSISFSQEMLPREPGVKSTSRAAHIHFENPDSEPHRSRTPLSLKSSQSSVSHKSHTSRNSTGRSSYRVHRGPPARERTPTPLQDTSCHDTLHSTTPTRPELGSAAVPGNIIARPSANDPSQPGEPTDAAHRFFPMSVNGVLRYENRKIRTPGGLDYGIEAMLYEYPETPEVPRGWTAHRHPEGALYFVHDESKTFTEVDICDDEIHEDIEYFRTFLFTELQAEIKNRNFTESLDINQVQLVLEPKQDETGLMCCYYFVNPRARSLFWLDEWEAYEIFKDCKGNLSTPHKGLAIQAQYWSHWDLYPNFSKITHELKDEVVDMILHATCDHLTSNRSSCPLNPEELKNHLSLIERIDPEKSGKRGHSAIIIGRIMHIFYNSYFLNFYGEDCARLNFDQTIHGWRYHPSVFMTTFAPFLFMVPVSNVRLLHKIFVDEIASKEKWNMFITKLNSQLQETSVLATVLLNANVGFLPKESGMGASPSEFLSYMSLVASMASIILGLVFMGHSRTDARSSPFEAAKFLHGLQHKRHGLETLAIVYSLPHAFLMWGMFLFFAAFSVEWYYPGNTTSRACIGAFMLVLATLVAWCIWTARDRCDFWWFQPDPKESEYEGPEEEGGGGKEWSFLCGFTTLFGNSKIPNPSRKRVMSCKMLRVLSMLARRKHWLTGLTVLGVRQDKRFSWS
ncbi:hypothetical protein JVU11DRAFT_5766 [Chiua virens]|nr:hypothetical protein JVU11DRAFT_5766 [Chiua virens]